MALRSSVQVAEPPVHHQLLAAALRPVLMLGSGTERKHVLILLANRAPAKPQGAAANCRDSENGIERSTVLFSPSLGCRDSFTVGDRQFTLAQIDSSEAASAPHLRGRGSRIFLVGFRKACFTPLRKIIGLNSSRTLGCITGLF